MRKRCLIIKSNDLKSSFEAINLNKNFRKIDRKIINVLQKVKDKKDEKLWIKKIIKIFKIMHKNQ